MAAKHIILVEIDWDAGTEGYGLERYRTPSLDYLDLIKNIGSIDRSVSLFGAMQFPSISIDFFNRDLYFSKKMATQLCRGRALRVKIIAPGDGLSDAITVFTGRITSGPLRNGIFAVQAAGQNFEDILNSTVAQLIPTFSRAVFPNLPDNTTPDLVPLYYGRMNSPGDDRSGPAIPSKIPARLVETAGITNFDWVVGTAASSNVWEAIGTNESICVAVASTGTGNRAMTSPDCTAWTGRTSAADNEWTSVCGHRSSSTFVAVARTGTGNRAMTSGDSGATWTIRVSAEDNTWECVATDGVFGSAVYIAVASTGTNRVMRSVDAGVTWAAIAAAEANEWKSVCYSPELDLWVAVASSGTNRVMTSADDGVTWIAHLAPTNNWVTVAWCDGLGLFVAGSSNVQGSSVMISEDGLNWLLVPTPLSGYPRQIAWSRQLQMLAATVVTSGGSEVWTSEDAFEWTVRTNPTTYSYKGLVWNRVNNRFVSVATASGKIQVSPTDLDDLYQYAIGIGDISGASRPGNQQVFVFRYNEPLNLASGVAADIRNLVTHQSETFTGHDVTVLTFAVDQRDPARPSEHEITIYAGGYATTVTSAPELSPVAAKYHFMTTYGGFTAGQIASLVTATALAVTQQYSQEDTEASEGFTPASLGAAIADATESVRSVLEKFDKSFGMITYQTRTGTVGVIVSPIGADETATVEVTDAINILDGTFSDEDVPDIATHLQLNYAGQGTDNTGGRFLYEIPNNQSAIFPTSASALITQPVDMPYCQRVSAAINVGRALGEYLRPGARMLSFELPLQYFDDIDIGTYLSVTHWQGLESAGLGYVDVTARCLGVSVILDPETARIRVTALKRAAGVVVHDTFARTASNALGLSWTESESAATALQIAANGMNAGYSQSTCLTALQNTRGIAYWDVTTDANQIASIEYMTWKDAVAATGSVGVGVRMSGTDASFTGYVALLVRNSSNVYTVELREYNAAAWSGAGTLLGSYTLTTPVSPVAAGSDTIYYAAGDVIELRATGTTLQVFYFSNSPANNLGKIIEVTDATITSGKMGIASKLNAAALAVVLITNFYGRSFT